MTNTPDGDIDSFQALGLSAPLLTALADVGYETPSPIQAACIPHLMAGFDLLGEAQTGTGKTAAFALPLLHRLDLNSKRTQVLVLTPTRELAIQVAEAFQRYAKYLRDFHVLPIYGGQSMVVQLRQLSRGAQVIVGTPGRVMDHLERKSLSLDGLKALVLDEADEMLRMGFIEDVEWILEHTPAERQTALFSATMPEPIRRVARRHMREPREVKIKSATTTVATIQQRYWLVRGANKLDALTRMLEVEEDLDAAIVFVRTKTATVELADKMEARGYSVAALNGDMTQGLRERVIEQLKSGSLDIVVATDVAARGIDVPRVSHVINYDIPYDTEAYVHRIGRTGRAGRTGNAILFVAPRETGMLRAIERATRQPIQQIALPSAQAVAERRVSQFKQEVVDALASDDMDFFMDVVRQLEEEQSVSAQEIAAALVYLAQRERPLQLEGGGAADEQATRRARHDETSPRGPNERNDRAPAQRERPVQSEHRPVERPIPQERSHFDKPAGPAPAQFEDTHTSQRHDKQEHRAFERERENRSEILERRRAVASGALQRYRIEVGRNHGATPKEIVGAIANEGGLEGRQIGQIHLFNDYSTVELPADLPNSVLGKLQRTRVCQTQIKIRLLAPGEAEEKPQRSPARGAHPEIARKLANKPDSIWELSTERSTERSTKRSTERSIERNTDRSADRPAPRKSTRGGPPVRDRDASKTYAPDDRPRRPDTAPNAEPQTPPKRGFGGAFTGKSTRTEERTPRGTEGRRSSGFSERTPAGEVPPKRAPKTTSGSFETTKKPAFKAPPTRKPKRG